MFSPLGKLLCGAALAGTALAQDFSVVVASPKATTLTAGSSAILQIAREKPSSDSVSELGIAIAVPACSGSCDGLDQSPSDVVYNGPYDPQPSGAEYPYQDIPVILPDRFNGPAQIIVTRFYLDSADRTPKLQFAAVNVTIAGLEG